MSDQPSQYCAASHRQIVSWLGRGLVLPTSGSTGTPKLVQLSPQALAASADRTNELLGDGHWVLALPLSHVAGWLVLARAEAAGRQIAACAGPFTATSFGAAVASLPPGEPWCTALVPTQLARLLACAQSGAVLASAQYVLLGGAACPPPLVAAADAAGVRLVRTYGMTETSGGCVYDGVPLPGVRVATDDVGRLLIAGPVLADGYVGGFPSADFWVDAHGVRWHRTSDLGQVRDGVVQVWGRVDDVVITGGEKVHPLAVERVVAALPGVSAVVVVGVPHPEWGEQVVALVDGQVSVGSVRSACAESLLPYQVPKEVVFGLVPRGRLGKVDRRAARLVVLRALGRSDDCG